MLRFPFLRSKPIAKKKSIEYKEMQKRIAEKKKQNYPEVESVIEEIETPDWFSLPLKLCAIPSFITLVGLFKSDYLQWDFTKFLKLSGYWSVIYSTFVGSLLTGYEIVKYHPSQYMLPINTIFTSGVRLFVSFSMLPIGVYGFYAINKESWENLLLYLIAQSFTCLYFMSSSNRSLMPSWMARLQNPLMMYCQILIGALTLFLVKKTSYVARIRDTMKQINEGKYGDKKEEIST